MIFTNCLFCYAPLTQYAGTYVRCISCHRTRIYDVCVDLYFCDYTIRLTTYQSPEPWWEIATGYGGAPDYYSTNFKHIYFEYGVIDLTDIKALEERMQYFALFA